MLVIVFIQTDDLLICVLSIIWHTVVVVTLPEITIANFFVFPDFNLKWYCNFYKINQCFPFLQGVKYIQIRHRLLGSVCSFLRKTTTKLNAEPYNNVRHVTFSQRFIHHRIKCSFFWSNQALFRKIGLWNLGENCPLWDFRDFHFVPRWKSWLEELGSRYSVIPLERVRLLW